MGLLNSSRCNNHISAQRGFCALEKGHTDPCAVMPRVKEQGIETPVKRVLIKTVPAHYIKVPQVKDTLVKCLGWSVGDNNGCGAMLPVSSLEYIQTHWYTEPYSCSGGDYWNMGEGQFICTACGTKNSLYERPAVEALKCKFKNVKDDYTRH